MIETRYLKYFIAIAKEQNITKAAKSLHITQSTLSKQMMDLEAQLGKKLFIRGKRKITLTEEGFFLQNKAQEILELIENTESAFSTEDKSLHGDIYIGCGETIAMNKIADIFANFHSKNPLVKFHIHSGSANTILDRLDKGLIDMGLLLGPIKQDKYEYLKLNQKDIFGLVMPSDCQLALKPAVSINELKNLPLIISEIAFSNSQHIDMFGIDFSSLNIIGTYNLIYNATFFIEKGLGYAFCIDKLVDTFNNKNLIFRPIEPEISVELYIVTKKYQTFSPAVKAFYNILLENIISNK